MAQAAAISTAGMSALQTQALSTPLASPIVLDLNGDGVRTVSVAEGVQFALGADGLLRQTGWVSSGDGLLVRDLNGDGVINNGRELFGTATELSPGVTAVDGFAALRTLDSNGDGSITSADTAFSELAVWKDVDGNGLTGAGELVSLSEAGVAALHLDATVSTATDNGNLLGLVSSYETTAGTQRDLVDVWFRQGDITTDPLRSAVSDLTESLGSYLESGGAVATAAAEGLYEQGNTPASTLAGASATNTAPTTSSLLTPLSDYYRGSTGGASGTEASTNLVGLLTGSGAQTLSLPSVSLASIDTVKVK